MDAVAAAAKASNATLYRRWNTKADLVVDALNRAKCRPSVIDSDTGSLRDDLIETTCANFGLNDARTLDVLASVITALHRDKEFADAFHERFLPPRIAESRAVYERARERGEIPAAVDVDLISAVLPAIVTHRQFVLRLPVDTTPWDASLSWIVTGYTLAFGAYCCSAAA